VTAHEGDLVIDGTQIFLIENCTFVQRGNIYIKASGKLQVRKSTLEVIQHYHYEYQITAEDQASVDIENSNVDSGFEHCFESRDNTSLRVVNSSIPRLGIIGRQHSIVTILNSVIFEAGPVDYCKMMISDSRFNWATNLDFIHGNHVLNLVGLRPGVFQYWNLHENQTAQNVTYDFTLSNTTVQAWSATFSPQDTVATVSDSVIERLGLVYNDVEVQLEGVKPGYYGRYNISRISLTNTYASGHWGVWFGNASGSITNSEVCLGISGSGLVSIRNSQIVLDTGFYSGTISFSQSTLTVSHLGIHSSNFNIIGNLSLQPAGEWAGIWWHSSNVTRSYNVIVEDAYGQSVPNAGVILLSKNATPVWSGLTDSSGEATFSLTFADDNYTDALRLEAVKGNLSATEDITFLSDTPFILQLTRRTSGGDVNGDGTVDIYDAIMLAHAYNSRMGDSNWDPNADINSDWTVDIYDAILLANNYGKTA
jgi:hypothetical protein